MEHIYKTTIREAERRYEIPQNLWLNLLRAESKGFAQKVIFGIGFNDKGIIGIAGLMPETAAQYGVKDRRDPIESIFGGARYFVHLYRKFGTWQRAIMAYNWGEEKTRSHSLTGAQGTRQHTREFVSKIITGVSI